MRAEREQRLVFGDIAEAYDASRPSYPDALFDTVMTRAGMKAGDRALEIGAGTGKAWTSFAARGLQVLCLEPTAGMANVLRAKGAEVEETLFEAWTPRPFPLVYAAQAWHWVQGDDRYEKLAAALEPGGSIALFWNEGRPHPEPFVFDNDAAYERFWPKLARRVAPGLGWVRDEIDACGLFTACEFDVFTWETSYTRDEWLALLRTHSDHQLIPAETRTQLHEAVGAAIDKHGGAVPVIYDTQLFFARKR